LSIVQVVVVVFDIIEKAPKIFQSISPAKCLIHKIII